MKIDIDDRDALFTPITRILMVYYIYAVWVIREVKESPRWSWRWWLAFPAILLFAIGDVAYNWTVGTVIFWELPREWVFTSRLKRHKKGPDPERRKYADRICAELNKHDPGHC